MNALPTELLRQAQQLSEEVTRPIPGSRKIHVEGSRPDLQVPMREIALSPTPRVYGIQEPNAPFCTYDTSGPYTDPDAAIDLAAGLKALRAQGLVVDQVQVNMQVATVDRSADTGQNSAQNQQAGQQTFQSGNQGGSERQQQGEAAGNGVRTADERLVQTTDTPATDARGTRPDQLYV